MRQLYRRVLLCQPARPIAHRYLLHVALTASALSPRILTVIQKNPSLANAERCDPTVGKVESWARHNAFDRVIYVNLFALRSPHPTRINQVELRAAIGVDNDAFILHACGQAEIIVAAWGNPNGVDPARYRQRIEEVLTLIRLAGYPLHRVGALTKAGHPRHGLHWNGDAALSLWKQAGLSSQ
ncbi:MAG: DUF1643 domain-containing protein [Caldilinea sp.]|nr:DUF1643 domain-containing protein [Caldilinea sp.]MDW8439392.1 DUF1643 domain-containing protein [Caldilineaceae bacterium]